MLAEKRANLNKKPAAKAFKADPKDFEGMKSYTREVRAPLRAQAAQVVFRMARRAVTATRAAPAGHRQEGRRAGGGAGAEEQEADRRAEAGRVCQGAQG